MRFRIALHEVVRALLVCVAVFGGVAALGGVPASAQPSRCVANGDIVTFEGVASPNMDAAHRSGWVLHLSRPICVTRRSPHAPAEKIFAIRIIGTPPPLNIPLQLTGKLLLGGTLPGPTMFAALAVISGRKEQTTASQPPARSLPSRTPVLPPSSATPRQASNARCDAPPYGGTQADYQAFVSRFGRIIKPQKILAGICNAKFGNASRDGLHKLGLGDAKIDSESTERLGGDTIIALKNLVNTIE